MNGFNDWLDGVLGGKPATVESFARSAIPELPRIETPVARVGRADVWPPHVLEQIRRIQAGLEDEL